MQVCTLLQTDNHTSTPPLLFFTGRMPFLPPNQQRQSTEDACMQCKKIQRPRFHHCLTPLGELTPCSWLGGSWLPLPQEFKNPIPLSAFHALPLTTRLIFRNSNTGGRAEAMLLHQISLETCWCQTTTASLLSFSWTAACARSTAAATMTSSRPRPLLGHVTAVASPTRTSPIGYSTSAAVTSRPVLTSCWRVHARLCRANGLLLELLFVYFSFFLYSVCIP